MTVEKYLKEEGDTGSGEKVHLCQGGRGIPYRSPKPAARFKMFTYGMTALKPRKNLSS